MYKKYFKRFLDVILAAAVLLLFSPLLVLIALSVKLTSKGPVFFRQERGGRNGCYFILLKFRSMTVDGHAERKGFEPGCARRITALGKFLRKTKLDELPQFINVLKGEMAVVGPRPEVRPNIELYPDRWRKILTVRPGLTDSASIIFRNEEQLLAAAEDPEDEYKNTILPRKMTICEKYVDSVSFGHDLKIMLRTALVIVSD